MPRSRHFTWMKTGTKPETWSLGIAVSFGLHSICGNVERTGDGWIWQRWRTRETRDADRYRHEGGWAPTIAEAMHAAGHDLMTTRREVAHA